MWQRAGARHFGGAQSPQQPAQPRAARDGKAPRKDAARHSRAVWARTARLRCYDPAQMTAAVREIPPAPRTVRWAAVMFRHWRTALCGLLLFGFGSLLTAMLWLGANSSHVAEAERRLDARSQRAWGTITETSPTRSGALRVAYSFTAEDGEQVDGACFVQKGALAERLVLDASTAALVEIEYRPDQPGESRVVGGHVVFLVGWHRFGFWFAVLPGLLALTTWLHRVWSARRVLATGDVAVADELACRELRLLVPTMLDVRFRFRDRQGRVRDGRHLLTARSTLGRRACEPGARLAVVHDREHPTRHQLVVPEDFVVLARTPRPQPDPA